MAANKFPATGLPVKMHAATPASRTGSRQNLPAVMTFPHYARDSRCFPSNSGTAGVSVIELCLCPRCVSDLNCTAVRQSTEYILFSVVLPCQLHFAGVLEHVVQISNAVKP
jgi:hypothetical protein